MQRFSLAVLLMLLIPFKVNAEEIVKKDDLLNLDQCIEIAIKKHPDIAAAVNTVGISQSRVGQAKAGYYPQIEWSSGYRRYSPIGSISDRSFDEYSSSVTLKQNIFDFGKTTTQVNIQRLNLRSSNSDLEDTMQQILFNVKQAYYGVLQAGRNRDVAIEVVKQYEQHLEQAKGFYDVGTKPKIDVTKAEVDLSNTKLNLIKAENSLRISKATLNNAMGAPDMPEYKIKDTLSFQKYEISFEDAIHKAYENRPNLKSIISRKQSAEESIGLAEKGYYPVLSGNASYNWSGERFPIENGWDAGVTVTFPIFSGFLTKNQVEEARLNLNVLKVNEDSLRQKIFLEIQQAYLNLQESAERISVAEITVKQAEENLDLAKGRYEVGLGNSVELTDAMVTYTNAKTAYNQALYDYKIAEASLLKGMGDK